MMFVASSMGEAEPPTRTPTTSPYGSWQSPITTHMLVEGTVRIGDISVDGNVLYWVESRPEEQGRYVIARRDAEGVVHDLLPSPFSARTLVHEYGGGALLASAGTVYFSNYTDQRIWSVIPGETPEDAALRPITPEGDLRFADFVHDPTRNRLISVCEDHHGNDEASNRIVAIDLESGQLTTLVEGSDFYSNPRVSPNSRQLAWLSWHHPNMPWDGTELFVASFDENGLLEESRKVGGGDTESIFQPSWSPDGTLYFVSDRTNWWNLYREQNGQLQPIFPMDAEFGAPQWVFGMTTYGFEANGNLVARCSQGGNHAIVHGS